MFSEWFPKALIFNGLVECFSFACKLPVAAAELSSSKQEKQ